MMRIITMEGAGNFMRFLNVGWYGGGLIGFLLFLLALYTRKRKGEGKAEDGTPIPVVRGQLPFFGHGLYFFQDILGFIAECHRRYGPVFQVKLFRKTMVVLCDQELAAAYFKHVEKNLSLEEELKDLNFDWPFIRPGFKFTDSVTLFRKTVAIGADAILPLMDAEVVSVIGRIREGIRSRGGQHIVCAEELTHRFIARTSYACFISPDLKDEHLEEMKRFFGLVNNVITSSYFVPPGLVKWMLRRRTAAWRDIITSTFHPIIQNHRNNPAKTDSLLIRKAIEMGLRDEDIGNILLTFIYVSTENSAVGLANVLILLGQPANKTFLDELRLECEGKAAEELLHSCPLLNACAMEMARLTTHLFSIQRKPLKSGLKFGDYWVGGGVDVVVVAGQMVMVHGQSALRFKDPLAFNPRRFLGKDKASSVSPNIVTWGGGAHLCPGRTFALYEIKLALAALAVNFDFELVGSPSPFNYFAPIGLAKTKARLAFRERIIQ